MHSDVRGNVSETPAISFDKKIKHIFGQNFPEKFVLYSENLKSSRYVYCIGLA
jgi:hypothetical protein